MNFNEKTILVKLTILLCVLCDLVMSKVSRALIGWPRSRDPEAASDWSESRNVEWLNPLDMTSDYCIIRINEIHSTARLPHSGLASGQEGWARWARRKYRVSGGDPWVIVIMWGEWEHGAVSWPGDSMLWRIKNIWEWNCDKWPASRFTFDVRAHSH